MVHVHLGLYGAFTELPVPMGLPVGQVRMRIEGAEFGTDLRGATACELIDAPQVDAILARLGPDPLRPRSDPASAFERIAKSHRPIGALLMDQKIIAGVGNVYRSEVLFRRRIDPYREGSRLDRNSSPRSGAIWWIGCASDCGSARSSPSILSTTAATRPMLRTARAPTCTGVQVRRAGCAERRSSPRKWTRETSSGVPHVKLADDRRDDACGCKLR